MQIIPKDFQDPVKLLDELKTRPEEYWIKRGEVRALELFKQMSSRVPAYKDFLRKNKIDSEKIKTISDFKQVPTIDKNNYLRVYPREMLCWDGEFKNKRWTISATSGSTGEPYYFPREEEQDRQYAITAELYLRTNFEIHKRSTLYIDAFPMGVWIGGLFTYEAIKLVSRRGYPLSIITPGINKIEIIKAIKNLGENFDQIIIGCYGPFLKDVVDDASLYNLNWKDYNVKFIFSAEGFNEVFRDYILRKTGQKDPYRTTLNHYGLVDLGTVSHETPLSILIRRLAVGNRKIYEAVFSDIIKLPTLTQYNPEHFYFEDNNGDLICSAFSGIPLSRYDLKDHGGVITLQQMFKKLNVCGIDLCLEAKKAKITDTIWNLPFVYVYERSDFSVSFFAFQIYPETIRKALQHDSLEDKITGKFTMIVKLDKKSDQYLEINLELKKNIASSEELKKTVQNFVIRQLLEESSEYRKVTEEYPDRTIPQIVFWPYEDKLYFRPGIKQRWVNK